MPVSGSDLHRSSEFSVRGITRELLLQIATGKGALGQLQLELGLPSYGVDLLVLGILGYSLAGAFNPATYSEANQKDVKKRNPGECNALACLRIAGLFILVTGCLIVCKLSRIQSLPVSGSHLRHAYAAACVAPKSNLQ